MLNHLFLAFKLMTLFMDPLQDLGILMSKVLVLNKTSDFRTLDTVNANITLIKQWFARADSEVKSCFLYNSFWHLEVFDTLY